MCKLYKAHIPDALVVIQSEVRVLGPDCVTSAWSLYARPLTAWFMIVRVYEESLTQAAQHLKEGEAQYCMFKRGFPIFDYEGVWAVSCWNVKGHIIRPEV